MVCNKQLSENYLCGWSTCSVLPRRCDRPPPQLSSPKKGSEKCFPSSYFNDLSNIYLIAWRPVLQTCGFQGSHKLNASPLSDIYPCLHLSATFDPGLTSYLLGILPEASVPMSIQFSSVLLFFHRLRDPGRNLGYRMCTGPKPYEQERRWASLGAVKPQAVRKEHWAYTHYCVLCHSQMDRALLHVWVSQKRCGPEKNAPSSKEVPATFYRPHSGAVWA